MQSERFPGLHAVVAMQRGRIVLENYFEAIDERIGCAPERVHFGPDVSHDLRSVTKSIVGLLCGIVVSECGLDVRRPLPELLPRWAAHFNAGTSALTLQHVLTMTMGIAWDESFSYADPRNSEIAMARSADRVAYVLSRPVLEPPGVRWRYCGGATEILAAVIHEHAGASLADFAAQRLFGPLDVRRVEWNGDANGPYAASGLRMSARDLLRVGELVLRRGRALVPESWLQTALHTHVLIEGAFGYGYHFYNGRLQAGPRDLSFHAAMGNGGQRLYVLPALEACVVIYAGHYNDWKLMQELPGRVLREQVLPLLAAG